MQSYPPARHLLRDLRVRVSREGGLWSARAPVVPEVCGADGAARASFLAALVDVAGGRTGAGLASPGTPAVSNGLGILHGAAQAIALEAAVERAELLREAKDGCLVRAGLVDRGRADALVAIGWASAALL